MADANSSSTGTTEGASIIDRLNRNVIWPGSNTVVNVRGAAALLTSLFSRTGEPDQDISESIRLIVSGLRAEMDHLRDAMDSADDIAYDLKSGGMTTTADKSEETKSMDREINIDALADALMARMRRLPVPLDVELWGIEDIAAYLKRSRSHVQQRYCPLPGFPRAIRLPGGGHPLYRASEVIEWAERHRDRRRAA